MKNDGIVAVMFRVMQWSGRSSSQFVSGIIWRVFERLLEAVPMVVCFLWVQSVMNAETGLADEGYSALTMAAVLGVVFIAQLGCAMVGQRNSFLGSYFIMGGYREKLLDRVQQLPLGTLYKYRTGQLTDMVTEDVHRIENIFTHLAIEVLTSFIVPVMLVLGLMGFNWELAVSLLVGLPFALLVLHVCRKLFARVSQTKQDSFRDASGLIVEFVTGIRPLRLFHRTDRWLTRLYRHFDLIIKATIGVETWGAGPVVLYRLLLELGLVVFLVVAARTVELGSVDPLNLILFMLLAYRVLSPLYDMGQHLTVLRFAVQSELKLQRLYGEPLLPEPEIPVSPEDYGISFNLVRFAYEDSPVLNSLSFEVPQNTITAIVGPSGAGKSTVMNLLARFYDPSQGSVCIGGVDIRIMGTDLLYQNISMVFQQVQLFDGTVMDNVRVGRPTATDDEVIDACSAAYCDDFIRQLPDGYHTIIGEGGACLSGGERQRVSIARALLKNAPIIMLDEATASVDSVTQYHLQQALSQLVKDKTVIMIAHRLSTVRDADQILVLDKGRIAQKGKHECLLRQGGLYQELWSAQNGTFDN